MSLYDDPASQGRKGVLQLSEAVKLTKKKIEDRERFEKFTEKFGKKSGF